MSHYLIYFFVIIWFDTQLSRIRMILSTTNYSYEMIHYFVHTSIQTMVDVADVVCEDDVDDEDGVDVADVVL